MGARTANPRFRAMTTDYDKSPDDDERLRVEDEARALAEELEAKQKRHAKAAQEYGYAKEQFEHVADTIRYMDPEDLPGVESSINKFRAYMHAKEDDTKIYSSEVSSLSYGVSTATHSLSVSSIEWMADRATVALHAPNPPDNWSRERIEECAERLDGLNPMFGSLLRAAWEAFYGGAEEGERAALMQMRQLCDHFFEELAPTSEVLAAREREAQAGTQELKVSRRERLHFAAVSHIRDAELRALLESEVSNMTRAYDKLNKLHTRGPVNREESLSSLRGMQTILEQWIDAVDL